MTGTTSDVCSHHYFTRILKVQRSAGDTLATRRPSRCKFTPTSIIRFDHRATNVEQLGPQTVKSISYHLDGDPRFPPLLTAPPAYRSNTFRRPSSTGEGAGWNTSPKLPLSSTHAYHNSPKPGINIGRAVIESFQHFQQDSRRIGNGPCAMLVEGASWRWIFYVVTMMGALISVWAVPP